ncbi:MAG: alpha/beta fold hydrolase [Desulfuromonadia bacterium]
MTQAFPLSLRISGDGIPVVFIHGWGMGGVAWRFQSPLATRYRLIIPDLPGYGDSHPSPSDQWTTTSLAGGLAKALERLVEEPPFFVGWSLGSLIALRFLRTFPEKVRGVILVGGTARFSTTDGYDAGLPPRDIRGLALRLRRNYGDTMGGFFSRMFADGELDHDQYQKIVREIILPGRQPSLDVALQGLELLANEDLRGELSHLHHPSLILHGLGDTITPPASARYIADRLPHASLQYLPGIGHAPFLSRPEEFNSLVSSFIDEVTS